jgi:hypothetical protein
VNNEYEAELLRGLLATAGIHSVQRPTDFAAGAFGGLPGPQRLILVRASDLEAARELVEDQ